MGRSRHQRRGQPTVHRSRAAAATASYSCSKKGTTHGNKYAVTALPQNFRDDDRPIRSYGDGGYIWEGDDIDAARAAMTDWKKENPR